MVLVTIYLPEQVVHLRVDPLPYGTLLFGHRQAPNEEFQLRFDDKQLHSEGLFLFFRYFSVLLQLMQVKVPFSCLK